MEKMIQNKRKYTHVIEITTIFVALSFVMPSVFGVGTYAVTPTFSTAVNLSNDGNNAQYPMVANSGNHVYVAWTEESHGVLLRASDTGGVTWNASMKLSLKGGSTGYPVITANGSNVYVAWSQTVPTLGKIQQVYFAASADYGRTFSTPIIVDTNKSVAAVTPVLAAWGSNVYVSWTNSGPSYERSSTDGGKTWGTQAYLECSTNR